MDTTIDYLLAIGALVIGIMILTGNGAIFMKGGDSKSRQKEYDVKKMEKATGIACILAGLATGCNAIFANTFFQTIYIVLILVIFGGLFAYIKLKCKK